jgi:hypothetical protein
LSQLHSLKRNMVCMSFDCSGCAFKRQCTTAERRFLRRHLDEDALTRMNARANLELTTRRRCAAEHPFGTIKRMMGGQKPQGKPSRDGFSVLAYNMLRLKLQISGSLFPFPHSLVACRVEAGGKNPKPFKMTQMLRVETEAPATRKQKGFYALPGTGFPLELAGADGPRYAGMRSSCSLGSRST